MPPRLNKRQQREMEELEALKSVKPLEKDLSGEDDSESQSVPPQRQTVGGFAHLLNRQESDEEEEEEELPKTPTKRKPKKKKKKPLEASEAATSQSTIVKGSEEDSKAKHPSSPAHPARNEKKAQKKARAKEKKAANDELDQVLAELSIQYPSSQRILQSASGKETISDLLSVSLQYLDGDAELRRFFGSKVVQANRPEQSSGRKKVPLVKSHLTRPLATWWAAEGREGLSLRAVTEDEVNEKLGRHGWLQIQEKWWTVEYSKKYKAVTKSFIDTVLSGDPQGFWDLMGVLPWHGDTLLQISEVYRHREEHAQAVDFIDRALFTYERAFIGAFTFTAGINRLDFDRIENRPFFLALNRQVTDLQRRGCVRTSFEFARLMYSLDPWTDPHGATFHLDFLAIKSGMHQWLLDVYELFSGQKSTHDEEMVSRLNPSLLPGWAYARAIALRVLELAKKDNGNVPSTEALKEAARDFPSIVPVLADKLDVTLPAAIRSHRDFKIETDAYYLSPQNGILHLLSHLYVQRSLPLWKEHTSWFATTITEAFSELSSSSLPITERRKSFLTQYSNQNLCFSVYRHIMVLETSFRRLFSFIPKKVVESKSLACDPLPPPTSLSQYDQAFFRNVEDLYSPRVRTRRQRVNDERRLAQLIPDAAFREQLQAFFDHHPHMAQRFPGGILQFAQAVGQLPPDVLEQLMMIEAVNGQGEMPGGFDLADEPEGGDGGAIHVDFENVVNDLREFEPPPGNARVPVPPVNAPVPPVNVVPRAEGLVDDDEEEEEEEEIISPMPRAIRNVLRRFLGWNNRVEEESSSDDEGEQPSQVDNTGVD